MTFPELGSGGKIASLHFLDESIAKSETERSEWHERFK